MPRFPNDRFSGFCKFHIEKKSFAVEINTLYHFLYFLLHIRPFVMISNYNKTNLINIYMFKVGNKNTRTRYEACLKLKFTINIPEQHCQTLTAQKMKFSVKDFFGKCRVYRNTWLGNIIIFVI